MQLDLNPSRSQLAQFGVASLIAFPGIGALLHFVNGWVPIEVFWVLLGVGVVVFAFAQAKVWAPVRWVYVGLMVVAFPIGLVVSNVLLGLIYLLMFTPMALWFRLIGRDAMRRRLDPEAVTYWEERDPDVPPKRYFRLF